MRASTRGGVAAALVFLLPTVAALDASFPLSGSLKGEEPLGVSGGLLVDPADDAGFAYFQLAQIPRDARPEVLRADKVQMNLLRYRGGPSIEHASVSADPVPVSNILDPGTNLGVLSDVRLTLRQAHARPQVEFFETVTGPDGLQSHIAAQGLECAIAEPAAGEKVEYPQDPDQVNHDPIPPHKPIPKQLGARCHGNNVTSQNPLRARIYGMDLLLSSTERGEEIIRTGTFKEEFYVRDSPLDHTVTQILEVYYYGEPAHFQFPFDAELQMYSRSFLAAGQLRAPASEGQITWGALVQDGPIEPFDATGTFQIRWAEGGFVAVDGQTVDAPRMASADHVPLISKPILWAAAAAVGAGLLAFLARAAWPLFSKLLPERVLEHPRRSRILEFVRAQPGVETNTLARSLGMSWGNVVHHVGTLQRHGQITVQHVGGRTALFPANQGYRGKEAGIVLLRRDTTRRIHELLEAKPGLDQAGLSVTLQLTQQRISQSLRTMEEARLVRLEQDGRRRRYFANPLTN